MKEKLKLIIESYFKKEEISKIFDYKLESNDELLIITDKTGKELDFFNFIFDRSENIEDIDSKKIYNNLIEKDEKLKNIESFDKNLNFIYFLELEKYNITSELKTPAHEIEENKYYAKEKVIFYTDKLMQEFINYALDISNIGEVTENMDNENKFLLDLVVGLSFIQIDFNGVLLENIENDVFKESFKEIKNDLKVVMNTKEISTEIFTENEGDFREKLEKINTDNSGNYNINNKALTEFEMDLISLLGEGKEGLEKEILSFKYTKNEDK